jgi:ketosteroid isomerase-like protein
MGEMAMGQAAEIVKRWVELYSDGTPDTYGSDRFLELYAPNANWMEMPSPMHPSGRTGDAETIRKDLKQNSRMFRNRRVELKEIIEEGNIAAWTAIWSASVAVDAPDSNPVKAGSRIQIRLAVITEVVDGLIVRQHEYISNPEVV